ncbi:hypothetical protein C8F04DRAFT_1226556 [Mycena alexandri]|uniref:C2 domain-containing protein n=1 Tax=Mycena alexandri TaxID=1745969 RepID=A0AAD6TLJ9_9AGAR|nr:hypothetical protein C8F04DRAFT_1226556 [Mycena alexandri]
MAEARKLNGGSKEIGTLIVVILKANHLPNKRNIGKQDPYCLVAVNGEKQRTKVIKRGGQHPEWDEELRFTLYEDDTEVAINPLNGTPPPPPPKDGTKNIKGGTVMKVSCFADDPREPDLIGQADVDLTEVLTKGETDEWFTLTNKDKFAGKVYLELTFWSNEPPPEKKVVPVAPKTNHEYSGPGSFISSDDIHTPPPGPGPASRVVSTSSVYPHSRRPSDSFASTLPSSNSLAQLDLYRPPYEQEPRGRTPSFSTLTNDFGELSFGDQGRRRESLPPQSTIYHGRPSSSYSTYPPPHGYEPSITDGASTYSYDRPLTPPGQSQDTFTRPAPYPPQAPYQAQYDPSSYNPPPAARGPRYSMPTASGFRPLPSSSSFTPLPSHPSDPSGFAAPLSHTPAPPASYPPAPGSGYAPPLPPSSSAGFHPQQGFPPSQSFQYSQFQPQPLPQQYNPPPTHMQTPTPPAQQGYPLPPSPTHTPTASLSHSNSLSASTGSRPLPQQPQFHAAQGQQPYGLPPSTSQPSHQGSYSPGHPGASVFQDNYQPPPPPPPPVSLNQNMGHQSYIAGDPNSPYHSPPPPPAPPAHSNASPRRQSSLPPPPTHLQQPNYPPLPPPPPPPLEYTPHNPPPPPPPLPTHIASSPQSYYPVPPPRPPTLDGQAQWMQPSQPQHGYAQQGWS